MDAYDDLDFDEIKQIELQPEVVDYVIRLTKEQGEMIKDLIRHHYSHTFPRYCIRVGMKPPNFYNALNGSRPCSLTQLNKLLSGVGYEVVVINPCLLIRELTTGQIVPDVDSILLERESQLLEQEEQDPYGYCSSEKLQENLRTPPDTHLLE